MHAPSAYPAKSYQKQITIPAHAEITPESVHPLDGIMPKKASTEGLETGTPGSATPTKAGKAAKPVKGARPNAL